MKKIILVLLIILSFCSCQNGMQTPAKDELLKKELQSINWKEVDEFPSVTECEQIKDKELRKACFFEFLTQTIQEKLSSDTIATLYSGLDTINVKVTIFPNATIQFDPEFTKDSIAYDSIKIDSVLNARLIDLPKINPAIKRGIPVKTQFTLPVILKKD